MKRATAPQGIDWRHQAECRGEDPGLFFGPAGETKPERDLRERVAKGVCASCLVRTECLSYALDGPEKHGVYGGLGEEERATERRKRMRRAARETNAQAVRQHLAATFAERAS